MSARASPCAETPVPLVVPLAAWREPLEILPVFSADPMPVLLHSEATRARDTGRWSLLCADPFERITWSNGQAADPIAILADALEERRCSAAGELPFAGGAVGYLGYDVGRAIESVPCKAAPGLDLPDLLFGLYSWGVLWDHHRGAWAIVSSGLPETGAARREKARHDAALVARRIESAGVGASSPARAFATAATVPRPIASTVPRLEYLHMVREARNLIADGQVYQVNLSQRLELPAPVDPVTLCGAMARHSPAPFSGYLDAGPFQMISASPERFLKLRDGIAESRPIKGTRPRGGTPERDEALRRELIDSEKDRAENIMIVDLVRNDLGRVCRPGSVRAVEICRVETFASVHHLTSIVTGALDERRGRADLLRALFPGGSMTGAPKVRAMQAIEELEPQRRGIYAGALGYLSFCGGMDLGMVIRTAIVTSNRTWLQVGGGIVADSEPLAEYQESLDKADSVLRALATAWPRPDQGAARRGSC